VKGGLLLCGGQVSGHRGRWKTTTGVSRYLQMNPVGIELGGTIVVGLVRLRV